ncbi:MULTISPECIES: cell surface protein [unclassified Comamonas]|uniref:cell surface protein n=1 Tax=unclassified Comamonas TaxID=2638500 RepID=UPI001EFB7DC2|nr:MULTISPECIES: cell surface protein [unclassified Comamonas]ULR89290.1 cell surface protein [Comamonas sp. B21-038]
MKKNVLALSIAAMIGGFAGAASAQVFPNTGMTPATAATLEQSEGGAGHILVVPYFTSQNDNMSVFHVVNTDTVNGKALKVRFRGAANSDDILDFTVFLSPGDVWTGSVQGNEQGSTFLTNDKSCTLPDIRGQQVQFVTDRLPSDATAAQTKEGYVEILNMADIKPSTDEKSIYFATKHKNGVAPCTSEVLDQTLNINPLSTTSVAAASALGFDTPSGKLTADWYILNVNQTTTFSGAATAIAATGGNGRGNFVLFPQDETNSAATSGNAASLTADPLLKGNIVKPVNFDFPDLSTPYLATTANPEAQASRLTQAVANNGVSNQFALDTLIAAKTDWVLSMPTRRYSVGADYTKKPTDAAYRVFNTGVVDLASARYFTPENTYVNTANGLICANTNAYTFWDREETSKRNGAVISPSTLKGLDFCGEVNVLSFNDAAGTSVLGASVARTNVQVGYENGWGAISYTKALPVVGSSFIKLMNSGGAANGFSGTYGITWPHRFAKPVAAQ